MSRLVACLNNYSTVSIVSRYRVVCLLHNVSENITIKSAETRKKNHKKRCTNGVPQSTQTSEDKSDGKYTKPNSYIFALL